jgi:hypothetical protein
MPSIKLSILLIINTKSNIQTGLSGIWSVISGSGSIGTPQNPLTIVTGLGPNQNKFAFTISVPSCNTSVSDTLTITREVNPINLGKDTLVCQTGVSTYPLSGPAGMSSYTWSTNQTTPQIVVSGNGTYSLSVLTPLACTFTDTVKVSFCVSSEKSISSLTNARIFPNPTFGSSSLEVNKFTGNELNLEILDMKGVLLEKSEFSVQDENSSIKLPENLRSGIYHIRISGLDFHQNIKWIIQK